MPVWCRLGAGTCGCGEREIVFHPALMDGSDNQVKSISKNRRVRTVCSKPLFVV